MVQTASKQPELKGYDPGNNMKVTYVSSTYGQARGFLDGWSKNLVWPKEKGRGQKEVKIPWYDKGWKGMLESTGKLSVSWHQVGIIRLVMFIF